MYKYDFIIEETLSGTFTEDKDINEIPKPNINADSDPNEVTAKENIDESGTGISVIEFNTEDDNNFNSNTDVIDTNIDVIDTNVEEIDANENIDETNTPAWMFDQDYPSRTRYIFL